MPANTVCENYRRVFVRISSGGHQVISTVYRMSVGTILAALAFVDHTIDFDLWHGRTVCVLIRFIGAPCCVSSKATIFAITGIFPAILCLLAFFLHERPSTGRHNFCDQFTILWSHLRKPHIWRPALFMFIWQATPSSQSSYFFFLTNDIKLKVRHASDLS